MDKVSKELKLFVSPLTNRVYATRDVKQMDEETGAVIVAGKKEDVTESFLRCLASYALLQADDLANGKV